MFSSNVYKNTGLNSPEAEPYVLEDFGSSPGTGQSAAAEKKVGNDALVIERQAYERGFKSGEKAGFELGRKKAEVLFQGLDGVLGEISTFRDSLYKSCEKEIVELVLAIARKVIQREIEDRRDSVVDCVKASLKRVVASSSVVIKINTKDIEVINQYKEELTRFSDGIRELSIEGDDRISRGGCVIETNYGEVDATITGLLVEIEERLKSAE